MYQLYEKTIQLSDGREITIETGKLAKQADGSVVVSMGKTKILAAVCVAKEAKENVDFMPLSVEYKEKFAAAGRFPGGFLKREARPGDNEILICRLVDRALRPLFPADFHAEVFVTLSLLSADMDARPDALAGLAASAALTLTDIPFGGPISECRVARVDGKLKSNPTSDELEIADMEILIGATIENILMVEGEMDEVSEADMLEAIKFGHEEIKKQCQAQLDLRAELGITGFKEYDHEPKDEDLKNQIHKACYDKVYEIAKSQNTKHERSEAWTEVRDSFIESLGEELEDSVILMAKRYFHDVEKDATRNLLLAEGIRLDGRKSDEIRPIWSEIDYLPSAHGSAIFTRGETQSLTTVTLGSKLDEKIIDEVMLQGRDRLLLHYNFPPFSTGDARPMRGTSRREIGHGNLALRALKPVIPKGEDNPYVIRIVSDILESNGSSSMATVCAGTLALMDAGIKIRKPVSGIAMGLVINEEGKYSVLSDILGDEDHLGDMDFKVTGTRDGITACQMDIKVDGLSYEILENALEQARDGRFHIMDKMMETISEPREDYKPHVPRIVKIFIPKDMIGAVIGPGGKIIQEIQAETSTVISIEEADGQGIVEISSNDKASIDAALEIVNSIVAVPEVGGIYKGKIKSIVPFGAFVEILPGKEGLLHISEIDWKRIEKVEDVLKEGEEIEVKLIEVDQKTNKLRLSRKALLKRPPRDPNQGGGSSDRRPSGNRPNNPRRERE
ncbi:MAG: polyribonucleotide nucleotidyltransferase [Bacteroidetes bacterium]|jgi:polyribonucleotide nucleotidyltransferase|nr:polyribonucleotide nucleotidyltransferase [Bacteroidota bacterium]MBT4398967.1 polyribonucleotide nucleotidyltransferase [Bacteroidota bacterium]MBT4409758.1 polyribonucleotide nucleotidyltransferase [Bacteroidota bacterium]MBT5425670.1 polyribonucleotide nucleotidyltransferase [Bacteroidota bacterium]MBT7465649.1 polyribonucleotide nucleotidyltransferase [Bacteroidota bacterium]